MWDEPQSLNRLSAALLGFSLLLALVGGLYYTLHLPVFPLRVLQLNTAPLRADPAQIEAAAREALRGNFFTVNLDRARQSFEKLHWVRKVSVRRQFPWRLEVSLEEHDALAQWNGSGLVNTHGEVFAAALPEANPALPKFSGPDDAAGEMAQMYRAFGEQLAPLGREIVQLNLSPRHSWQLRLDNGTVLELGNEQPQQRLERFVAVYPYSLATLLKAGGDTAAGAEKEAQATAQKQAVKYVDLRYRNGFAVSLGGATAVKGET
ncbi:MAG: cell division protein FtsQ [Gallionellaceae bacterium]|nr:MAG: cell division protein FtsQ [Gallionellaceae bacterium]